MSHSSRLLTIGALTAVGLSVLVMGALPRSLAQPPTRFLLARQVDQFPPNPLDVLPDAVLPQLPLREVQRQVEGLNQQAIERLQSGAAGKAFELWNQSLRLSRQLGPVAETKALARVGEIAWQRSNTQQVRYISQRLQQIQAGDIAAPAPSPTALSPTPLSESLLAELAVAYQVIRAPELALSVYNQALKRQLADPVVRFRLFNRIAQTHLDWFDYTKAAQVYQDLLSQAQAQNNPVNQMAYAYQLAYVYEQAKQPPGAIAALETLVSTYAKTPEPLLLADFQTRLAAQYQLNQQVALAETTYQAAYRTAIAQQQTGFAGDALRQLAAFYRQQQRFDAAIQVYDFLTTFEQESALNPYNAMDAYDRLGQIWLDQREKPQAIAAFQQGLVLAQSLNYREQYFRDRLAQISGKTDTPTAVPESATPESAAPESTKPQPVDAVTAPD
ncbi:hypothetical protein IQ266_11730 [filamentous cyanobacterium LEGE 11480]|uniref:Tetratricopeptide repeat protein n=1 Tax=Romeriopsis navalis LEGE 11480 TaxID=2777977 RepID=A0A928VMM3_9CYAN|nr:hypothetical protein [Romeriopsis navalis]MBE9030402.1 hypothetical protein [Romeriopsis navalis LEGE 11480]